MIDAAQYEHNIPLEAIFPHFLNRGCPMEAIFRMVAVRVEQNRFCIGAINVLRMDYILPAFGLSTETP